MSSFSVKGDLIVSGSIGSTFGPYIILTDDSTPYNIKVTDYKVLVDTNVLNGNMSLNLPEYTNSGERRYFIKDIGNNASNYNIIISPSGGDTLEGGAGNFTISTNLGYLYIFSYNSVWYLG